MKHVQVTFSDEDIRYLSAQAKATGQPIAAVVRNAVAGDRGREEQRRRRDAALGVIGKYRSGRHDVSENHDEDVVQAIEERIGRR